MNFSHEHDHVDESAPRAGRREWTGLAVHALPCLLYAMAMMDPSAMPFDAKRMFWGGFKSMIEF